MKKIPALRNFLYLNENIVDSYLAQLEGTVVEGPYTSRETVSNGKEGGLNVKAVIEASGKGSTSHSSEIQKTIRETAPAKFTRLYNQLKGDQENNQIIQVLNGFDQTVYDSIEVTEIVEVRGKARLPQWEHWSKLLTMMPSLSELGKAFGQDPLEDPQVRTIYTYLSSVRKDIDTVITIAPFGSPQFKFVAKLDTARILVEKEELDAEVTILGKVTRRLTKGEKIEIISLLPDMDKISAQLNRNQRRRVGTNKINIPSTKTPLDEAVTYPAIQVLPIAIYQ